MKLFITNKEHFEDTSGDWSSEIHKRAFNELRDSIENHNIPLFIMALNSEKHESISVFQFKRVVKDVYFYEFTGTAS